LDKFDLDLLGPKTGLTVLLRWCPARSRATPCQEDGKSARAKTPSCASDNPLATVGDLGGHVERAARSRATPCQEDGNFARAKPPSCAAETPRVTVGNLRGHVERVAFAPGQSRQAAISRDRSICAERYTAEKPLRIRTQIGCRRRRVVFINGRRSICVHGHDTGFIAVDNRYMLDCGASTGEFTRCSTRKMGCR
jgi:hypothetical protein